MSQFTRATPKDLFNVRSNNCCLSVRWASSAAAVVHAMFFDEKKTVGIKLKEKFPRLISDFQFPSSDDEVLNIMRFDSAVCDANRHSNENYCTHEEQ